MAPWLDRIDRDWDILKEAAEAIFWAADDWWDEAHQTVHPAIQARATDLLAQRLYERLLARDEQDRIAFLDARDAGDVDDDGEPVPYDRYPS